MPFSFSVSMLSALITQGKFLKFNPAADLFHCTDYKLIPMKCPTITTLYDVITLMPEFGRNTYRSRLIAQIIKRSAHFSDHVITISHHAARDLMQYFHIQEEKISVIPLAAEDTWYDSLSEQYCREVCDKYHLSGNYFLSVGTIQPRKNIARLIDAYLKLPVTMQKEYPLVIIGKYGWNCEVLRQRMQLLCAEGKLIWLTDIPDEELRCIYQGAHVFVFPSLYEGFGIPLVEAFASGVPVICSNRTSLPEVSQGAALEVDPESVNELAAAMEYLASNSAERARRIQLGKIRASQLRWDQTFEKTMAVYRQVLGR